jgi:putative transposase
MGNSRRAPKRRLHRLPNAVYTKTEYEFFFTLCARHHARPFEDRRLASAVIDSLKWTRTRYDWLLFCYCLMPDHLHFICRLARHSGQVTNAGVRGQCVESVLDHVARFKSFTTSRSWTLGLHGPLWQRSSYDRAFDIEHAFEDTVQYVLDNPVRKGLVGDWRDWPYSEIVDPWWQ